LGFSGNVFFIVERVGRGRGFRVFTRCEGRQKFIQVGGFAAANT
jgi:hypothetical protein